VDTYKYVLVGGGVASQKAAEAIRARDAEGSILIVAGEHHLPYQRPPLSKVYLLRARPADLVYVKGEEYYAANRIDVWRGADCATIDGAQHLLSVGDGRQVTYGKLLVATGASPWVPPIPGADLPGIYTLATIEDADAIREAAPAGARALVVGGGFIGSEVAASLVQRGLSVAMAFMEKGLQQRIAPADLSAHLARMYTERGVRLIPECAVKRFLGDGHVQQAELSSGELLPVDLVVMGAGVRPNSAIARLAGLTMEANGGVTVDDHLRTSDPDVYAAGDVASWPDRTFGKRMRVEHLDVARRQGTTAGANMAGADEVYSALPYFFTSLFDLAMEVWGDLSRWDTTIRRGEFEGSRFAIFYFSEGLMVAAMAGRGSEEERRLLPLIVAARPTLNQVGSRLADASLPLSQVLQ
jgi:NADPH-dependent 2,4-dienoyl-CoA reductase/sulfur reductase-like enzyme